MLEASLNPTKLNYRGAVLNNQGSVTDMRNAIWSGLWHSMSTDEQPQHHQCPTGEDSSCFYQRALAKGDEPPSHKEHPTNTYLTREVAHQMIPLYRPMSDEALLQKMSHGKTQNNNECFNSLIWMSCPKTLFFGKRRIEAAVSRAVLKFNEGAQSMTHVMNRLHIDMTVTSLSVLEQIDERRVAKADKYSQEDFVKKKKN